MIIDKDSYLPLSFSSLKAFSASPLSFVAYKLHKSPPTPSMLFGTRLHMAILEPDKFRDEVVVYEGRRDMRSKEFRDFLEDNPGASIVTPAEMAKIKLARGRLRFHNQAMELLDRCENFETPVTFTRRGFVHRGIIDAHGDNIAVDIKTAKDWTTDGFTRTAWTAMYFMQAAMYVEALRQHGQKIDAFYFVVIQNSEPFNVSVFEVANSYLQFGMWRWAELLEAFDAWDGKPAHIHPGELDLHTLEAPRWADVETAATWLPDE